MPYGVYNKIICDKGNHPPFTPQEHQSEVLDYFINKSRYKGLCLYHRLGSGKSCSSIMISDEMLKLARVKKVFVLTPGSLRQNFIEEYCDKCGYKPKYLKKYYTFITTNYSVGERLPKFNNSFVIIDEVHNLINGVKNQSKHYTLIYNALMKSDCRILTLTGTPVFNYIWEWPLLGNLLKPNTFVDILRDGKLDPMVFERKFEIDQDGNVKPKNPRGFSIQLKGIISYFPGKSGDGYYPEVIHEKPITIRMTIPQNETYWKLADWEEGIRLKGQPPLSLLRKDPEKYANDMEKFIMSSKYIISRLTSNFYYPENIRGASNVATRDELHRIGEIIKYKYKPTGEIGISKKYFINELYNSRLQDYKLDLVDQNKELTKEDWKNVCKEINLEVQRDVKKNIIKEPVLSNIGWVKKSHFSNHQLSDMYSRKITAVMTNLVGHWKAKHVLFTFFKNKGGANIIHALLQMCGIKSEIYSGDIGDSQRQQILKTFNAENNRYGDKIKILLVTEAGAEGINILEAQHMHILESSSREMKIQQAIGRVVRYRSHAVEGRKPMPKNEQKVHVWRYWSTSDPEPYTIETTYEDSDGSTKSAKKVIVDKTCVDEILYKKGIYTVNTMASFLNLLKESSVTNYDKSSDSSGKLKDWGLIETPEKLIEAYKISDDRYINNKIPDSTSSIDDIFKDIQEDKDIYDENVEDSKPKKKSKNNIKEQKEKFYIEIVKLYKLKDLKKNPNKIFVFGDNLKRKGEVGQAIIRGKENAYGIVTKKSPSTKSSSYFTDKELEQNKKVIDKDIEKIKSDGRKIIVFPQDGLGTGLDKLKKKAPKTYEYLNYRLLDEFSFDNDKGELVLD